MERLSDNMVFIWSLILSNVHHQVLLWTCDSIFFKLFVNISYWNNLREFSLCCLRDLIRCNFPFPRGRVCCDLIGAHWRGLFHIRSLYTYVTSSVVIPRKVLWSGHYSRWHLTPPLLPKCNALTFPLYKSDQSQAWITQCNGVLTLQNFINKYTTNSKNVQRKQKNDKDQFTGC